MERRLISEYLAVIDEFSTTLNVNNLPFAIELARLPEQIRGFGHVKERSKVAAKNVALSCCVITEKRHREATHRCAAA